MNIWTQITCVAVGGALGAVGRFLTTTAMVRMFGAGFPWGTLAVNWIGCFVLGLFLGSQLAESNVWKFTLAIGFLASFTTFSTFGAETIALLKNQQLGLAIAYVLGSLIVGVLAVGFGLRLTTSNL